MGKKKYIIEVDDKYVMGTLPPRKLMMPVSLGIVGDDKNAWMIDTGFELTNYVEPPEEPKEEKTEHQFTVGDIVKNLYDNRIMVITRLNDDGTMNVMDSDGSFHIWHQHEACFCEGSTALWLSLMVLQKLERGQKI